MDVITYPCWDLSQSMLLKRSLVSKAPLFIKLDQLDLSIYLRSVKTVCCLPGCSAITKFCDMRGGETLTQEVILRHDDIIKWKHFPRYWPYVKGNSPVTGEFPAQRPVARSFIVFFDLHPNKRLSKQPWIWWFETPLRPLWRHCNDNA